MSAVFFFILMGQSFAANEIPPVSFNANTTQNSLHHSTKDSQGEITHFHREEIKEAPVVNLGELLRQQQSVVRLTKNSGDSTQTTLSIRGFGDNAGVNSLILVDGFPLVNPSLLAPNFNSIVLADISRIEIIQGSRGSLFGDQAVGGVVNIITRHPKRFLGDAAVGWGSFNKLFYSALLGTKFNNGLFFKGFGFSERADNYRAHNQQNDATVFFETGFAYASGNVSFNVQSYHHTVEYPGILTAAQFKKNPRQAINFANFSHDEIWNYQLFNQQELHSDWMLETRLLWRQIHGNGLVYSSFNRHEWLMNFNPRLLGLFLNNKTTLGYTLQMSGYHMANRLSEQKTAAKQHNFYGQIVFPVAEQPIDFTLGARFAKQENFIQKKINRSIDTTDQVFVTEQGLNFKPNPYWQFFLRRDGNFRFPKSNEETKIKLNENSLKTQTGVSYEAGFLWHNVQQITQLNVYYLQLENEIAFDPTKTPEAPFGSFHNFKKTQRMGVTLAENYEMTPRLTLDGQFNYVNARFLSGPFAGKQIPAVPAVNANVGCQYAFWPHWKLQYNAIYTGSRFASEDNMNKAKKLSSYWLNSLAVQYILDALLVSFEVINLFNQRYSAFTLFNPITQNYLFSPGESRSFLLTLKANID